jgi:hypothetical protein
LIIGYRQTAVAQIAYRAALLSAEGAGTREIARMRLAWMEKLRTTLSEYHSILMSIENLDQEATRQKLSQLGTELDLLLNQDDLLQKALWDITDKIYKCEILAARESMDEEMIRAGRAVLKAEWEKVKAEMRGDEFQTGEQHDA